MPANRPKRNADYKATLIYLDEPQLILLVSRTVHLLAVAVPTDDPKMALFLATTVNEKNLDLYFDGLVDLRYLFTYPRDHLLYTFDLMELQNNIIAMQLYDGDAPSDWLPSPRLFATEHTTTYHRSEVASSTEQLIIDGEWRMQEFGTFYQKYSDIYAFEASLQTWAASDSSPNEREAVRKTYADKAFEGGFSYVNFFHGLNDNLPRSVRPGLDSIKYASPGEVNITGSADVFERVYSLIENYLTLRHEITDEYSALYRFLSERRYLRMDVAHFKIDDPSSAFIENRTRALGNILGLADIDSIIALSQGNILVVAKVTLALVRRVEAAAAFFAQGRMNFSD